MNNFFRMDPTFTSMLIRRRLSKPRKSNILGLIPTLGALLRKKAYSRNKNYSRKSNYSRKKRMGRRRRRKDKRFLIKSVVNKLKRRRRRKRRGDLTSDFVSEFGGLEPEPSSKSLTRVAFEKGFQVMKDLLGSKKAKEIAKEAALKGSSSLMNKIKALGKTSTSQKDTAKALKSLANYTPIGSATYNPNIRGLFR